PWSSWASGPGRSSTRSSSAQTSGHSGPRPTRSSGPSGALRSTPSGSAGRSRGWSSWSGRATRRTSRSRPWTWSRSARARRSRSTTSPPEGPFASLTRRTAGPLTSRAAAMSLLREVGAVAGLASFLGLALLALLYFAQARDVRRLSENASFLVEGADGSTTAPAEKAATAVGAKEPAKAGAAAAASAPTDAEAFRRAELARQAAERRQRFEKRRRDPRRPSLGGRDRPAWLSEPRSVAIVAVGALLLLGGVAFGGRRILSSSSSSTSGDPKGGPSPFPPHQT